MSTPQHRADLFVDPGSDPREGGPRLGDERTTLTEFLRCQRLTLQLKCEGLDAGQLARRAVEPSTMSLLGLVRHMAEVERGWFRRRFGGLDVPKRYQTEADPTPTSPGRSLTRLSWRRRGRRGARRSPSPGNSRATTTSASPAATPRVSRSLRELLVHMIEEYARHNGHADLLRERIDRRVGQLHSRQTQTLAI